MKPTVPVMLAAPVALAVCGVFPASGQGESWLGAELPSAESSAPSLLLPAGRRAPEAEEAVPWQLGPSAESSPAWLLALWGVAPYAELQSAGMPLPPSRAEVAALPVEQRMREKSVLKALWLECQVRAREERNRVTRENLARVALLAHQLGAPAGFADLLQLQVIGGQSPRERYLTEAAVQLFFDSYGVDSREIRFFVEGCGLTPAELREVVAWLPLPALFDKVKIVRSLDGAPSVPPARLAADYAAELVVRSELVSAWRGVTSLASADSAAETLLPALARHMSALPSMLNATPSQNASVLAPYARYSAPVKAAWERERARMQEHGFFGSCRLQALDYLFH